MGHRTAGLTGTRQLDTMGVTIRNQLHMVAEVKRLVQLKQAT